jgi:hypothetical protein
VVRPEFSDTANCSRTICFDLVSGTDRPPSATDLP